MSSPISLLPIASPLPPPRKRFEDCLAEGFMHLRRARHAFCEATFKAMTEDGGKRAEQLVAYMDAMQDILTGFVADVPVGPREPDTKMDYNAKRPRKHGGKAF